MAAPLTFVRAVWHVPPTSAPLRERVALEVKLAGDIMHGFTDYVRLVKCAHRAGEPSRKWHTETRTENPHSPSLTYVP